MPTHQDVPEIKSVVHPNFLAGAMSQEVRGFPRKQGECEDKVKNTLTLACIDRLLRSPGDVWANDSITVLVGVSPLGGKCSIACHYCV